MSETRHVAGSQNSFSNRDGRGSNKYEMWCSVIFLRHFAGPSAVAGTPLVARTRVARCVCDFGVLCPAPSDPDLTGFCAHAVQWMRVSHTIMSTVGIGLPYPGISGHTARVGPCLGVPRKASNEASQGRQESLDQQQLSLTHSTGWTAKSSTNCIQWESVHGKSRDMSSGWRREPYPRGTFFEWWTLATNTELITDTSRLSIINSCTRTC